MPRYFILPTLIAFWIGAFTIVARGDDAKFVIADGKITFTAPEGWKKIQPRVRIIEHEYQIDAVEGDKENGRMTIMGAGGSIEDNLNRWIGQFSQPDGSESKDKAKTEKKTVAGQEVYVLDIQGTYKDSPGPFAGGAVTNRPNYRMLAAIVLTPKDGNYFLKFYGPEKTVGENKEKFEKMIESLEAK